jgi:hypothetical protein
LPKTVWSTSAPDDIAISKDQRKLITDGDDLEAKSVMAITSVGANARTHGLL